MFKMRTIKNIGVFSKFDMCGGSENRCVELANAISKHSPHKAHLLCEKDLPDKLKIKLADNVNIHTNIFLPQPQNVHELYKLDHLLVVNTDSKLFSSLDYWLGKTDKHSTPVDLSKIKQITFLYNFIVSPCKGLAQIETVCPNLKIITANRKFFEEIGRKYDGVIHIPRMILESPIDPLSVSQDKSSSDYIRFGMHSKGLDDKWNKEWPILIDMVNREVGDEVKWRFKGCPNSLQDKLKGFSNVEQQKESPDVGGFLYDLDVFVFFPSYKREEPWSRSVAEGIMSGCPVITTPRGGNVDQVVHGNNGFLCKDVTEFGNRIILLAKNRTLIDAMRRDCIRRSREFTSKRVIEKFIDFIGA